MTRFLSVRFLVGLGLVSYGWYLWHWPLLVLGESLNLAPPPLWARVGLVLLGLFIAYLSYRFIEGLFYKRSGAVTKSKTWGSRRVIISGVVAMSTVASLSTGALALANDQATTPRWETVSQQLNDVPEMPSECLGENAFIPDQPNRCDLVPFDETRPTVVLWGDSHAWMLIPGIEAAAEDKDVNLVAFVMGACPPLLAPDDVQLACARSNQLALKFVTKFSGRKKPPLRVILSASWPTYRNVIDDVTLDERADGPGNDAYIRRIAALFTEGTPRLFEELSLVNADIDVVGPTPFIPRNAPLCEARARPFSCDVDRDLAIEGEADTVAWLEERMANFTDNSRYIDIAQSLCDEDTCYAEADGVVNFFDDNHISAALSRQLKSYFSPSIRGLTDLAESGEQARPAVRSTPTSRTSTPRRPAPRRPTTSSPATPQARPARPDDRDRLMAHPFRAAVAFTVALVALSGLAYLLQQTLYARPPVVDLTPTALEQPPQPVPAAPTVPADPEAAKAASGVPGIDQGWLDATSQASGVPVTALRAYARAELMAPRGCGLGWTTLAGIGWVESQHGQLGGRTLLADGHSSSLVLGPALNGVGDVKAIAATPESRQWHGDRRWDHAFGPMQFISSTWVAWQSDGDGDGVADPNDLDDAAFAAARYLCAGERDLTTAAGWTAGVLSYNNARSYLDAVHVAATAYADRTG